jgi:hypothetical protein
MTTCRVWRWRRLHRQSRQADDVLLQCGDYQLAPAGTRHRCTEIDTGAVIYAHGDLDLQLIAAG